MSTDNPISNDNDKNPNKEISPKSKKSKKKSKYIDDLNEDNLIINNNTNCKDYRVKVYTLSDDGNWKDEGTGYIEWKLITKPITNTNNINKIEVEKEKNSTDILEVKEDRTISLKVYSEETEHTDAPSTILLDHIAVRNILYDKQVNYNYIIYAKNLEINYVYTTTTI